jgi:hypothetical protein
VPSGYHSSKANGSPLAFFPVVSCGLGGSWGFLWTSGDRFPTALRPEFRPLPVVILAGRRVPLGKVRKQVNLHPLQNNRLRADESTGRLGLIVAQRKRPTGGESIAEPLWVPVTAGLREGVTIM